MEWLRNLRRPTAGLLSAPVCLLALLVQLSVQTVDGSEEKSNSNETERYHLFTWDFHHVEVPYVICLWILLASVAKIGFHLYDRLSSLFPESCLLIVMGISVGCVLHFTHTATSSQYSLDSKTFFLFLLPPIIYDAGYHMPLRAFFNNLGTILTLAVVNTLWNTVAIGFSLWAACYFGWIAPNISILNCLLFSALISAVDPVAVLAVFEDVHVNEMLYIIVFGESLLNDGVTVVLYHMMEGYAEIGLSNIIAIDFVTGIGSFFIIALGGTLIGVIYGIIGGFITKYTDHVRVIEPLFVFVLGYLAYLTAEMMHLSGILALTFGGITMRHYVEANMNEKSVVTTKYTMKMLANISETIIFVFLGLSTVVDNLDWQWDFIFFSILFCIIYRIVGVVCLSFLMNRRRVIQLSSIDQFIMSYGGLRGGIAFCLSLSINGSLVHERNMFITTTIVIVFFTVFVQGMTIKPVVNALKVKRKKEKNPSMNEMLNERLIDHVMAGMEDIIGRASHNSLKNRFEHFNVKFLKPMLLREKPQTRETSLLTVFSRLNVRDAMHHITSHGTFLGPLVMSEPNSKESGNNSQVSVGQSDVCFAPQPTVDIHSVESVYSKKDLDDSRMHHLLRGAMFRPRKTFVVEKKHTVEDRQTKQQLYHHQAHVQLPHLISLKAERRKDHHHTATSPTKVQTLAFHETAVMADETKTPPHENTKPEEEKESPVTFTVGLSLPNSGLTSIDSGNQSSVEDNGAPSAPEETETERVLPWKRTTQLPPVRSSMSLSMPDDDHPLMSQAPSWADNLAYNHLTESGSPYASPENTIGAPAPSSSHRPVFDIFPPTPDAVSPPSHSSPDQDKPSCSHDPLPPPWAIESSEDPPLTSPEAHDGGGGEKASAYLQSSSHNFYPPSHHNCLSSRDEDAEEATASAGSVRVHPANSPKHFQPITMTDMCRRQVIEEEMIADETDYQERLVTRVQSWLDSSEPSDEDHDFEELSHIGAENTTTHNDTEDDIDIDNMNIDTYL